MLVLEVMRPILKVLLCLQLAVPLFAFPTISIDVNVTADDDLDDMDDGDGDETERGRSKRNEAHLPPPEYALVEIPVILRPYLPMYNKTHCNLSQQEYLYMHRGPKHLPMFITIPLTIIYSMIFISGVLGNTLVAIVVVKNSNMHSATNFYLFSLAISDLMLLLLGLPNDLSVYWQQYPWIFGETVCRLRALCSEMSSYCSVMTIVAFSVERYLAVCRPLESYQISTFSRASKIIGAIWFSSLIFSLPFAILTDVNYLDFPPDSGRIIEESAFCAMLIKDVPTVPVYEVSTVLFFGIPLIALTYMYWEILKKLRERELYALNGQGLGVGQAQMARQQQSRKSIIRMLGAVVICFFLCWAPFHLQRLFYMHMSHSPNYQIINEWLYYVTGCFYFFSSTVNPILYTLMSTKYREAFRDILFCRRSRRVGRATLKGKRASEGTSSNRGGCSEEPQCSTEPSLMESSSRRRQSEQDTLVHASDQNGNTTTLLITRNGLNSKTALILGQTTEETDDVESPPHVELNDVKNASKETYI